MKYRTPELVCAAINVGKLSRESAMVMKRRCRQKGKDQEVIVWEDGIRLYDESVILSAVNS